MALGESVRSRGERRCRCRDLACQWTPDPSRMVIASVVPGWLGHAAWRDVLSGEVSGSLRGEEAMVVFLLECSVECEVPFHVQAILVADAFHEQGPWRCRKSTQFCRHLLRDN